MLNKTAKTLIMGIAICMLLSGTLSLAGYEAAKITYTISGSTGISGAVMNGLPGNPVTDKDGNYTATVDYGWAGTVMPMKEGYAFEPASKRYDSVTANQANQDYTATLLTFTVSGSAGMSGVVMDGLPGTPVTDKDGNYTAAVDYGFSGTVMPTKEGYIFKPARREYSNVTTGKTNQNYTAELLTFNISGVVTFGGNPMEGVTVSARNGGSSSITDTKGQYGITVGYGWNGIITPTKEGYIFELPSRKYTDVIRSQTNHNYTAEVLTYTISGMLAHGSLPLNGVTMNGLPGNPVTNEDGYYNGIVNHRWSGIVTPSKRGYLFDPANKTYEPVTTHQMQDYAATLLTYNISGSVGLNGVVMRGLPDEPISDANGNYTVTVGYGWSGTVVPTKEGYDFKPNRRIYDSATKDEKGDYTTELLSFIISGKIKLSDGSPISGAVLKGLPGDPVTNKEGFYTAIVDYGFSGTVTPEKEGCTFEPAKQIYTSVSADQSQDHAAKLLTYAISGIVTSGGKPIEGVSVLADNGGGTGKTDTFGKYEILVNHGFSGTVTPIKEGYTFEAAKQGYTNVTADKNEQNYEATLRTFTISGTIVIGGEPIEGVSMTSDNGGSSDTTNAQGRYSVTVPYGWSGTVTPTKEGYRFDPPTKRYLNVTSDIDEDKIEKESERDKAAEQYKEALRKKAEQMAIEQKATERRAAEQKAAERRLAEQSTAEREVAEQVAAEQETVEQETVELEAVERKVPDELIAEESIVEKAIAEEPIVEEPAEMSEQPLISNIFIDTDLRQVLQDIASQAGVTIIPDQTIEGLITCELTDVSLGKALEIVLAGTGYVVKKTPDYYLVCSPDPKDAAFIASSKTKSVKLNYVNAETAVKLLSPIFKNYIQADRVLGAVCITASPALMERIESDLELVDLPPRHVMLDARIVVMKRDDLLNLGVEWGWPKIKAGVFSSSDLHSGKTPAGGKWPWGIQIGYATGAEFTNSLELSLNLLERNGEATIVSSPQVLAQDGKQAEIKVTTEEYYSLLPETTEGQGNYYNRAELQKIEYGTVLNITPHIGRNNDITLDLAIEVSDVVMRTDNYPVVTRRVVNNTMRIRDGGTVSVAGLKKSETYSADTSTPGLSKLPIFGGLFKSKKTEESSQELAIFVTAHLISDSLVRPPSTPEREQTQPASERPIEEDFIKELEKSLSSPDKEN